ncbi:PREDICTED: phostensin [Nanorana parkeri]|uniref:phostensin n=1 Tax=Nanorana parkeri TaxID=125878 RepID=UPI0008543FE6|nr:PREDICTED: phostensin [Nanorana parkeri]
MEVPDWKFHLRERKKREEEEVKRRDREEDDRLAKMPAWKREIILRRKAKAEASVLENKVEVEGGEQEEREKTAFIEEEEKESRVLRENIGPVQQNPFIQQEKQRRIPEYSCTKSKPTTEQLVHRTAKTEDIVRDPQLANEVKDQEVRSEDHHPLSVESKGRVSRLLCRFGGSRTEDENNDPCLQWINGEGGSPSKIQSPSPVVLTDYETQASTAFASPVLSSPSCHRAVTGSQTLTQETTLSSHVSPSSSCIDSEPAELSPSVAPTAMSAFSNRPSMTEEARSFPFQLRPASASSPRQFKQTTQVSPAQTRPETLKPSPEKPEEDGERGLSPSRAPANLQTFKRAPVDSQAMQRRKGNTITVNPRKAPICENGVAATETKTLTAKPDLGKKRYPTVDEIKVIGGYLALSKSCLAKNTRDKKKMNISFPEAELERTFEYPSESSLQAEYGPCDEPEVPIPPLAQQEEDEEEESVLLGRILRRKALIVDESCKR